MRNVRFVLSCVLSLFGQIGFASSEAPVAATPVELEVSWFDWPDTQAAKTADGASATYRHQKLERDVTVELRELLRRNNVTTAHNVSEDGAKVSILVQVEAVRLVEKYTDSLFGTERNRPTRYQGQITITILANGKQHSEHSKNFSFDSGRTVGDTVSVAQAKVRGMISRWLERHIQKRKFKKLL